MAVRHVIGDATDPRGPGPCIIVHVCNNVGGWGAGFVLALSARWEEPERSYAAWYHGETTDMPFELGQVQFVKVEDDIWVANMIGQHGVSPERGVPPVRYEAIREGLRRVAARAKELGASVHMPRIGSGLAGGNWEEISKIVEEELASRGVEVTVYEKPK